MRDLIIDKIKETKLYRKMWESGDSLPSLNLMTNERLLDYYNYCMSRQG